MSFIIKTAKTVEEAIQAGLLDLGVERADVEIEVIEEPKSGFLGFGQKDAMVKIKQKEDISSFVRDILYDGKKVEKKTETKPKEEVVVKKSEPEKVEKAEKTETVKAEVETTKKVEKEEVEKFETLQEKETEKIQTKIVEEEAEEIEDFDNKEDYTYEKNIEEVWSDIEIKNKSEEFLSTIIDKFKVQYNLNIELNNNELNVEVTSNNPSELGIIIGKHGSTLDSLQYLLSQVINKHKEDFIRVTVDANEYRDKRKKNLEKIAKRGVERVQKYGRPVKLEPMNAADRRIVHMVLQNYETITTHSEGRDPFRRVVITKERKF